MPFPTLWSESLLRTSGSRLRKSARSPNETEPPALGGPAACSLEPPPPPPHAATTIRAAEIRIPSDRLRILLSPHPFRYRGVCSRAAGWRQLTPGKEGARGQNWSSEFGLVPSGGAVRTGDGYADGYGVH